MALLLPNLVRSIVTSSQDIVDGHDLSHELTPRKCWGKVEEYALLGIPEYWVVDYLGLGGVAFISKPKQPKFTVFQLVGDEYTRQQSRLGQQIGSSVLPNLQLRLDDVLPR